MLFLLYMKKINMKKEQLGSEYKSQRLDLCNFLVVGKPSNVATFVSNVVTDELKSHLFSAHFSD